MIIAEIMCVQFIGNEKHCILSNGSRIPMKDIKGESSVGKTVKYDNGEWSVTGSAPECEK